MQEKEYLDERMEMFREKISKIEELSLIKRTSSEESGFEISISSQDESLMELKEDFRDKEFQYSNLLTTIPGDSVKRKRWYIGKARDFKNLSARINELIMQADNLSLRYYDKKIFKNNNPFQ